ncbi:MAG TPA: YcgL domain-containing protein, partial [Pseudomonadaceae bacterium]|nr:YcgL domain-containing protein [Pseudomonadaceae bacterium]
LICTVYRCSREREMYVYVARSEGLARLPAELLEAAGTVSEVLTLRLSPERKLARARSADVLAAIAVQGYYLQLPPDKQLRHFTMGE